MQPLDEGARMRIDGPADPELMLADARNRQDVGWTPERLNRRLIVGNDKPARKATSRRLGAIGQLEISLTRNKRDLKRLQELRYQVFYEHGGAVASPAARASRRDEDDFDSSCDHLMVVDRSRSNAIAGRSPVVGTYRLLRQDVAEKQGGFYSAEEFDLSGLLARHAGLRFLELGRSCVLPAYRSRRAIELLWHGVWSYVREHQVDVMIGCASFESVDAARVARRCRFCITSRVHRSRGAPAPIRCGGSR
jgi:putative hemolysin